MEEYQNMRGLYDRIISATNNFELQDTGASYMFSHMELNLDVDLEGDLESGIRTHISLHAPLTEETNPEGMISRLQGIISIRDRLRSRGYQQMEHLDWFADGPVLLYDLQLHTEDEISELMSYLDEVREDVGSIN